MKLNKRVLFITGSHTLSGSEIANINVAEVLKNYGANIYYLVTPWSENKIGKYIRSKNIQTISYRIKTKVYDWRYVFQSFFLTFLDSYYLLKIIRKYGITSIHISSEHYVRIFIIYFAFSGKEIIYRMGDAPNIHRALFRWIWKKILFGKVKLFVCVSQYISDKIKSLGCPDDKIRIIYSYPFSRSTGNSFSRAKDEKESNTIISYAGQISRHKGVDVLVEAALLLCQINTKVIFRIAGDIQYNPDLYQELKNQIENSGLMERIQFVGFIDDIFQYFSNSDIHICPSVFEDPMPNVIFEAKSAGIPTVGFRSGGIPELIDHQSDGYLCDNKNADSLLKGINFFMNKENLAKAKISARQSLDSLGVNQKHFEDQWVAVYEQENEK